MQKYTKNAVGGIIYTLRVTVRLVAAATNLARTKQTYI